MSQYTMEENANFSNNTNSFNVWNNYTVTDDRSQLLTWLSPLEPGLRDQDLRDRRVKGVGEWLTQTEEFRRWSGLGSEGQGDKAILFCYGNPGVGKTFISSLVVDRLCDQTRRQNTAVTCFYFDFAARKEQSATSMLGSLLKQMVSVMERIPEEIWLALREQRKAVSGCGPQLVDIVKMLQHITSSQRTFMVIDALDECNAVQRFRLFDSLKEILAKCPGTRIFLTGRPHIRPEIKTRLAGQEASVSVGPARDDIVKFLRARLSEDETPDAMDASLAEDILEKIPENISEMFLLASLNIEAILQESTMFRRRERLNKITDGLGLEDVYGATIERIKAQGGDKSRLGIGALMWICHAERPLGPYELLHALAIELGSTNFNAGNTPSITTLVSCCQGLITADKEASTLRLTHFTLREYLFAHPEIFSRPHSEMAEICLTYLNSQQVKALSASPPDDLSALIDDNPFLDYCSLYWGVHAKKELSNCARSLALQLCREYDGHISAALLIYNFRDPLGNLYTGSLWSGLHCVSYFRIAGVVAALINMKCYDLNEGDYWGGTPLSCAAEKGHEEVVKILLGQEEVNPDKPDNLGGTPLSVAAKNGQVDVVKILLRQAEVNPNKSDNFDMTPLSRAAWGGHEGVVKILLGREEVNPDKPDNGGQTPLSCAAEYGHDGVVKIFLGREEVDPNKPDNYGKTPLAHAAYWGWEGVVNILLGRDEVDPGKPDIYGQTPLWNAASRGSVEVVKMLLEREEVDPNEPDYYGEAQLMVADRLGHQGVLALLRSHKKVTTVRPKRKKISS